MPVSSIIDQPDCREKLVLFLHDSIQKAGGWIGFDHFMQIVLYTPGYGYYSAGSVKLGCAGDYITAPILGNQFAHCLAVQCKEILANLDNSREKILVEFGAGTGQMALDILVYLDQLQALPDRYAIVETSADLADRQRKMFRAHAPEMLGVVEWISAIPADIHGVVLANEVLDAMPVKRFRIDEKGNPKELGVGLEEDKIVWKTGADLTDSLSHRLSTLNLPAGYQSEVGLQAEAWVATVTENLACGVIILIDYGFNRKEYYHHDRVDGTLMCHYHHVSHTDPFYLPGLQDITAHVDFNSVAAAAQRVGAEVAGYCAQGAFLISLGLLDRNEKNLAQPGPTRHAIELAQEMKKLMLPHEMGELFKVLALTRNYPRPLLGFTMKNNREQL